MVPSAADVAKTQYLLTGLVSLIGLYFLAHDAVSFFSAVAHRAAANARPAASMTPTSIETLGDFFMAWFPWLLVHVAAGVVLIIYAEPIACLLSPIRRGLKCPACWWIWLSRCVRSAACR